MCLKFLPLLPFHSSEIKWLGDIGNLGIQKILVIFNYLGPEEALIVRIKIEG